MTDIEVEPEPQPEPQVEEPKWIELDKDVRVDLNKVNEKLHKDIEFEWDCWVKDMCPDSKLSDYEHLLETSESWEEVNRLLTIDVKKRKKEADIKKKKEGKVIYY